MKRSTKKLLSSVLSLSLCFSFLPSVAFAAPEEEDYTLSYEFVNSDNNSGKIDNSGNLRYYGTEDVAINIKLTNNTGSVKTLQAFDYYINNASLLTFASYSNNDNNSVRVTQGNNASGNTQQHIQLIGKKENNQYVSPGITLPADEAVTLGTITYTAPSLSQITYQDVLEITFDTTKQANIAVANDQASHYPTISSPGGVIVYAQNPVVYYNADGTYFNTSYVGIGLNHTVRSIDSFANVVTPANKHFVGWSTTQGGSVEITAGQSISPTNSVSLYAVWSYDQYDVRFMGANGAQIGSTQRITYGNASSAPNSSTVLATISENADDYAFVGWTLSDTDKVGFPGYEGTIVDPSTLSITTATDFYPVFAVKTDYTVSFAAGSGFDGATNLPADITNIQRHSKISQPDTTPTLTGHTFAGWYSDSNCETPWNFASDTVNNSTTTIYAKFTPVSYNVTLNENGGSYQDYTEPTTYTYGIGLNLPTASNISKTGYLFMGWYDNSNLEGSAITSISTTATGDKTFYAKWEPISYTVRFNANGGENSMSDQSFTYGTAQGLTANAFVNNGRTFKGWSTEANPALNANISYTDQASVSNLTTTNGAIINLYAVWSTDAYTISYELDGGTVSGTNPTTYSVDTPSFTLINPTKAGYTFAGWSGTDLTGTANTTVTVSVHSTGNRTYTANWTPNDYTITYTGAGVSLDPVTYTIESEYVLATPGRAGYTFSGWTATTLASDTNWEQNTIYAAGTSVTNKYGDVTLTAQWVPVQYTITFAGTVTTIDPINYTINDTTALPVTSKPGYTFQGWKITSAAGNWILNDNVGTTYALNGNYGNVTLTAQWSPVIYTITYNLGNGTVATDNPQTYTIETETFTLNNPTKTGYTFAGWSGTDLTGTANTTVTVSVGSTGNRTYTANWTPITYHVYFKNENNEDVATRDYTVENPTVTAPDVPSKSGYDGAWNTYSIDVTNPQNITVTPNYVAIEYTITFNTNGGTAISAMTYTIESTDTLPSATGRANYSFTNWVVSSAAGNWEENSAINGGTAVTGKYGNVTLTAQWMTTLIGEIEQYKYAYTGYRLLRIDASALDENQIYTYDGVAMYYTNEESYQINSHPVFYTLIEAESDVFGEAHIAKVGITTGSRTTISYNGDVNGDEVVNIADANAVYQMLTNASAGGYYNTTQLGIRDRLAADTVRSTANAEYRASIEDVNFIVNIINAVG